MSNNNVPNSVPHTMPHRAALHNRRQVLRKAHQEQGKEEVQAGLQQQPVQAAELLEGLERALPPILQQRDGVKDEVYQGLHVLVRRNADTPQMGGVRGKLLPQLDYRGGIYCWEFDGDMN